MEDFETVMGNDNYASSRNGSVSLVKPIYCPGFEWLPKNPEYINIIDKRTRAKYAVPVLEFYENVYLTFKRFRILKQAGATEIPATILEEDGDIVVKKILRSLRKDRQRQTRQKSPEAEGEESGLAKRKKRAKKSKKDNGRKSKRQGKATRKKSKKSRSRRQSPSSASGSGSSSSSSSEDDNDDDDDEKPKRHEDKASRKDRTSSSSDDDNKRETGSRKRKSSKPRKHYRQETATQDDSGSKDDKGTKNRGNNSGKPTDATLNDQARPAMPTTPTFQQPAKSQPKPTSSLITRTTRTTRLNRTTRTTVNAANPSTLAAPFHETKERLKQFASLINKRLPFARQPPAGLSAFHAQRSISTPPQYPQYVRALSRQNVPLSAASTGPQQRPDMVLCVNVLNVEAP